MLIQRKILVDHLSKIYCDGQVGEAILQPDFSCTAMPRTQILIVIAPPLEGIASLEHEVGILDLGVLIRSLSPPGAMEDDEISIEFVEAPKPRILIEERYRGSARMVTGAPKIIGTQVEDSLVDDFLESLPEGGVPLPSTVVADVLHKMSLLPNASVAIRTGPVKSSFFVGQEEGGHNFDTDIPVLRSEEEYTVKFDQVVLKAVLKQIHDYTISQLTVSGPDGIIRISEGDYHYLVSPMRE